MNTLLLLLAATAVLLALAWTRQIYPYRSMLFLAAGPALLSLALIPWPGIFWGLIALDIAALTVAVIDLWTLPAAAAITVERSCGRIASLQKPHRVELTISHHGRRPRMVWVRDGAAAELRPEPDEFALVLSPRSRTTVEYEIRPDDRGRFVLESVFVRARSRWGLWQRMLDYPAETEIKVYPDMQQLAEYEILARTNRLSLMGVRRTRKIGQDNEFERLRDYTLDDNFKHIDWRSTARRGKLTVKDFQANQSQRIVFLIDCGRMMTGEAAGVSLLDHALNSMLMLSFIALQRGDQVGLICFSDEIHAYVPPRGGASQMNRLLHACYDRFPQRVESRYDEAFLYLASHCRKRALVVLVTNIIDEVNANQVQQYLTNLVGRHLPLGVLLRDRQIFEPVESYIGATTVSGRADDALFRAAAAAEILSWRQQVLSDLETKGVLALDVFPEQMTAPLINRYLDIKSRHLL